MDKLERKTLLKQATQQALKEQGSQARETLGLEMMYACSELSLALARERRGLPADTIDTLARTYIIYRQLKLLYGVAAVNEAVDRRLAEMAGAISHK